MPSKIGKSLVLPGKKLRMNKSLNRICEVIFMKKWSLFSVFLSLIFAFVAAPLEFVHANGNISGTARLRLVESYTRMDGNQPVKVDCSKGGFKRCLILRYNISGIKPGSTVKLGLYGRSCKGALQDNLDVSNIPLGDGADGREIRARVKFTTIPASPKLFFCVFDVGNGANTRLVQDEFTVAADKLTAIATVK